MSWLLALVSNPGCYSPLTGSFNLTLMSHVVECLTPYTPLSHCLLVSLPYHPGMGDFHVIHAEAHSSAEEFPPPLAHSLGSQIESSQLKELQSPYQRGYS